MNDLDIRILARLSNNCRESDKHAGKELGVSGNGVKKKIEKMVESHIIEKFSVKIQPHLFGYSVLCIVVPDGSMNDVIKRVQSVGEANSIIPCIDGKTICSIVIKDKIQKKIEMVNDLIKYVRVLFTFEAEDPDPNANFTKTGLKILDEMCKDSRQKHKAIAKNTKMSTGRVINQIKKFQQNKGIQFTLVFNPAKMSNFIPYIIFIEIKGEFERTIKDIDETFKERYLEDPLVTENQMMLFVYADVFEMDDMEQKVRTMQNVRSVDTFIPKKISFNHEWLKKSL